VIDQAHFKLRIVIQIHRGLVAQPGTAGLRAGVVACHIGRVGGAGVMLDVGFGHAACQFVIGFAIAQVEAGFQLWTEAITDIGCDAFAAASGMVLIAVGV
jgi:hypothetical protein